MAELTYDTAAKIELLNKLGQVAGDRLKDEERAVDAYRALLTLGSRTIAAPKEQLKKRYVTLGRWDDLEVFYAESGKWDEFIRVLESNETRATDTAQRIGIADEDRRRLWLTQRASQTAPHGPTRRVLTLRREQPASRCTERLIPMYTTANNPKGLATAIEVKLSHVQIPRTASGLLREVARSVRGAHQRQGQKAFDRYLWPRSSWLPPTCRVRRTWSAWRRSPRAGTT